MKLDLHVHTYYSGDAVASPASIVKAAKKKGLDGFAVTDHNHTDAWKESVSAGKKHGVHVIKAEEVAVFHEGKEMGELLVYFMENEIRPGDIADVLEKAREQDAIVAVAHPFDYLRNWFRRLEYFKGKVDAIEAINARVVMNGFNARAIRFARKNKLAMTAGSDAHCLYEVGNAYTSAKATDIEGFRKALKRGKTMVHGKKTNPLLHTISSMTKVGLKGFILQE